MPPPRAERGRVVLTVPWSEPETMVEWSLSTDDASRLVQGLCEAIAEVRGEAGAAVTVIGPRAERSAEQRGEEQR